MTLRCQVKCDKGSQCTRIAGHPDGYHLTEHDCVCLTEVTGEPEWLTHAREPEPFTEVFSEDEYRADTKRVIDHALATGRAVVVRADGSPRVVISIPPAHPGMVPDLDGSGQGEKDD